MFCDAVLNIQGPLVTVRLKRVCACQFYAASMVKYSNLIYPKSLSVVCMYFQFKACRKDCASVDPATETGLALFKPGFLRYFIHAFNEHLPNHSGLGME